MNTPPVNFWFEPAWTTTGLLPSGARQRFVVITHSSAIMEPPQKCFVWSAFSMLTTNAPALSSSSVVPPAICSLTKNWIIEIWEKNGFCSRSPNYWFRRLSLPGTCPTRTMITKIAIWMDIVGYFSSLWASKIKAMKCRWIYMILSYFLSNLDAR